MEIEANRKKGINNWQYWEMTLAERVWVAWYISLTGFCSWMKFRLAKRWKWFWNYSQQMGCSWYYRMPIYENVCIQNDSFLFFWISWCSSQLRNIWIMLANIAAVICKHGGSVSQNIYWKRYASLSWWDRNILHSRALLIQGKVFSILQQLQCFSAKHVESTIWTLINHVTPYKLISGQYCKK